MGGIHLHTSIPIDGTVEIIEATKVSPYLSHTKVKVCYVGQNPNRNNTVITKETAMEMGRTLPGSPIVGLFNAETEDFGGHDRQVAIKGDKFEMVDLTRPYGFVPTDAQVWFQKFNDEGVEHEYLCTECYIWTGAYPESQRIIDKGNNQSMELDADRGFWTEDLNSGQRIFIYNEALVKKLCVLGENIEPCFEGAQFFQLSLLEDLKKQVDSLVQKGGSQMEKEFEKKKAPKEEEEKEEQKQEEKEKASTSSPPEKEKEQKQEEKEKEDKNKKKYNLDEIPEYAELQKKFAALQSEKLELENEVEELRKFKLAADRNAKQSMIDSFYMLSDADKKDVQDNIDNYSLDDIEAKLSIICVRNKVNFNLDKEDKKEDRDSDKPQGMFNLDNALSEVDDAPDWIKAVRATVNK